MEQLSLFDSARSLGPSGTEDNKTPPPIHLIEPTKLGTFLLKRGVHKQSLHGGNARWTKGTEYASLAEAIKATLAEN